MKDSILIEPEARHMEIEFAGKVFEIGLASHPHEPKVAIEELSPTEIRVALNISGDGIISHTETISGVRLSVDVAPESDEYRLTYELSAT